VLTYGYTKELTLLNQAAAHMEKSLEYYRELARLTDGKYHHANSMLTAQRRIPITGADAENKLWSELLPHYEAELATLRKNIDFLRRTGGQGQAEIAALTAVPVTLPEETATVTLSPGAVLFTGGRSGGARIEAIDPALQGLTAVHMNGAAQGTRGTALSFSAAKPVSVLVGYFGSERPDYLKAPVLETNALGNEFGQADTRIANALKITGQPPMNVHTYTYPAGSHTLTLGNGIVAILGFVDGTAEIRQRDAGIAAATDKENVDWLFY
jgi:hypothetical protein